MLIAQIIHRGTGTASVQPCQHVALLHVIAPRQQLGQKCQPSRFWIICALRAEIIDPFGATNFIDHAKSGQQQKIQHRCEAARARSLMKPAHLPRHLRPQPAWLTSSSHAPFDPAPEWASTFSWPVNVHTATLEHQRTFCQCKDRRNVRPRESRRPPSSLCNRERPCRSSRGPAQPRSSSRQESPGSCNHSRPPIDCAVAIDRPAPASFDLLRSNPCAGLRTNGPRPAKSMRAVQAYVTLQQMGFQFVAAACPETVARPDPDSRIHRAGRAL